MIKELLKEYEQYRQEMDDINAMRGGNAILQPGFVSFMEWLREKENIGISEKITNPEIPENDFDIPF